MFRRDPDQRARDALEVAREEQDERRGDVERELAVARAAHADVTARWRDAVESGSDDASLNILAGRVAALGTRVKRAELRVRRTEKAISTLADSEDALADMRTRRAVETANDVVLESMQASHVASRVTGRPNAARTTLKIKRLTARMAKGDDEGDEEEDLSERAAAAELMRSVGRSVPPPIAGAAVRETTRLPNETPLQEKSGAVSALSAALASLPPLTALPPLTREEAEMA